MSRLAALKVRQAVSGKIPETNHSPQNLHRKQSWFSYNS